ncbi:hypothetical protein ACLESO_58020, partial [Pyxidicoccus sp. 3LG]
MATVSSVPDATHTHPPTPRGEDEALDVRPPDMAPWEPSQDEAPPEPGVEAGALEVRPADVVPWAPPDTGAPPEPRVEAEAR